jgi:hypothetical protein
MLDGNKSVTAVFERATYTLGIKIDGTDYGEVEVDQPPVGDANQPPCTYSYPGETQVTLTAVKKTGSTRDFKKWRIYDPNYSWDANYMVEDSNQTIHVLMNRNHEVEAYFDCTSGMRDLLPMMLITAGALRLIGGLSKRRRKMRTGERLC